ALPLVREEPVAVLAGARAAAHALAGRAAPPVAEERRAGAHAHRVHRRARGGARAHVQDRDPDLVGRGLAVVGHPVAAADPRPVEGARDLARDRPALAERARARARAGREVAERAGAAVRVRGAELAAPAVPVRDLAREAVGEHGVAVGAGAGAAAEALARRAVPADAELEVARALPGRVLRPARAAAGAGAVVPHRRTERVRLAR